MPATVPLLEVDRVSKWFPLRGPSLFRTAQGEVRAVDNVSFTIDDGATFGLVGESGSGKTTTARLVLTLEKPSAGRIIFRGQDLHQLRHAQLRQHRRNVQAVFQDPWSSLNPRMRAGEIIAEPLAENQPMRRDELQAKVVDLLVAVGLASADTQKFPHEFSGGQRQRVAIARAIALRPALIVLDEPVSSLDVSIRAQIMNLLKDLQESFQMTYLLIAHDLATVRYLCRHVGVMYLGQIVEHAPAEELFARPLHPYTQALIASAALSFADDHEQELPGIGEAPSPSQPPAGCRFHPRCPFAFDRCSVQVPELLEVAPNHQVACHLYSGSATS